MVLSAFRAIYSFFCCKVYSHKFSALELKGKQVGQLEKSGSQLVESVSLQSW